MFNGLNTPNEQVLKTIYKCIANTHSHSQVNNEYVKIKPTENRYAILNNATTWSL